MFRFIAFGTLGVLLSAPHASSQELPKYQGKTATQWARDLTSRDQEKHRAAVHALVQMGKNAKPATTALVRALSFADAPARSDLTRTLVSIGKDAVPALISALRSKDDVTRQQAAEVLAAMGSDAKSAASALAAVVGDQDAGPAAINALANLGPDAKVASRSLLVTVAVTNDATSREKAEAILVKLGAHAVPQLIEGLKARNAKERFAAAEILAKIGPDASTAVPALTAALKDKAIEVRDSAALALQRVKPGSAPAATSGVRDFAGNWAGTSTRNALLPNDAPVTFRLELDVSGQGSLIVTNMSNVSLSRRYTINLRGAKDGVVTFPGDNGSLRIVDKDTIGITLGRGIDAISGSLKREK